MKKTILPLVILIAGAALMAGCQTEGARAPLHTTKYDLENQHPFVLLDPGAQRSVTTSGLQQRKHPDGRFEVVANVRNRENRRIQVEINCEFKDAQGFVLEPTPFYTLILDENAQESVRFISMPNPDVERYTIRVRQAR